MTTTVSRDDQKNWTIASRLKDREEILSRWDDEFEHNHELVAQRIAESIGQEILKEIGEYFSDPYSPLVLEPLKLSYSFEIDTPSQAAKIKQWVGEREATLAPFKEWFDKFTDENEKNINVEYFQEKFARIGRILEGAIKAQLATFSSNPENRELEYKVQWHRGDNPWMPTNYLSVSIGLKERRLPEDGVAPSQAQAWRCTLL